MTNMLSDFLKEKYGPFPDYCEPDEAKGEGAFKWCENHFGWIVWDDEGQDEEVTMIVDEESGETIGMDAKNLAEIDDAATTSNMDPLIDYIKQSGSCKGFSTTDPHNYIELSGSVEEGWTAKGPDDIESFHRSATVALELIWPKLGEERKNLPVRYEDGEL
jgi:hypothetical protein